MKNWLLINLIIISLCSTWACATEPDLLSQLSARSKTIASLDGRFEQQKTIAVLPMPIRSSGEFHFTRGKGVIWETLVPVNSRIELTPNGINLGEQSAQSQQQQASAVVANIFMGVIAGKLDSLTHYFTIQTLGDASHWRLTLTPSSPNLAAYIQSIEVRGEEFTQQLDIAETNGDKTRIQFSTDKVVRTSPQ